MEREKTKTFSKILINFIGFFLFYSQIWLWLLALENDLWILGISYAFPLAIITTLNTFYNKKITVIGGVIAFAIMHLILLWISAGYIVFIYQFLIWTTLASFVIGILISYIYKKVIKTPKTKKIIFAILTILFVILLTYGTTKAIQTRKAVIEDLKLQQELGEMDRQSRIMYCEKLENSQEITECLKHSIRYYPHTTDRSTQMQEIFTVCAKILEYGEVCEESMMTHFISSDLWYLAKNENEATAYCNNLAANYNSKALPHLINKQELLSLCNTLKEENIAKRQSENK